MEQEKEYMNQNRGMKIVDPAENWTRGREISIDSVKSWNYFRNYGHKIGDIGYIDSYKTNPAH